MAIRVVCLGDLALDVVVRLRRPLALGGDAASTITVTAGGQAANVAAWVAALGGHSRWVGKRGDDGAGRLAAGSLEALGVELAGPVEPSGSGVVVSLVAPDGERSMCPDRGVGGDLRPEEIRPEWLAGDWLHVSGYALLEPPVRDAAIAAIGVARSQGAQISVDLSSWSAVEDAGADRFRSLLEGLAPDVVFANEAEDRVIGGPFDGPLWILKKGAAGCRFGDEEHAALPVTEVVDTTGAGDALAAGWLVGGPSLALEAAARCVGRVGSMP